MARIDNYYQKMTKIYNRLQDEESKTLFELRISYLLNRNDDEYMEMISELYKDWYPSTELEERMTALKPKGIIIFGCGNGGKMTGRMLSFWGYEASYFCDSHKFGEIIDGKKVLSVDEVLKDYRDYLVITASYLYGKEMYGKLVQEGFPETNILVPQNGFLLGLRGKQYFDVFKPQSEEIYVDAGTFDGETVLEFSEWTKGNYGKIYAFEPMSNMCGVIQKRVENKNVPRVEILNNAAWNRKEEIYFKEEGAGSCMDSNGEITVQGLDIDSAVNDEKVTFIKMDIEGSELKALEGAKNTIINNRPRLAICIYHKPMDVIEIASYLLELIPEYKFYIRHYTSYIWETVLYAEI